MPGSWRGIPLLLNSVWLLGQLVRVEVGMNKRWCRGLRGFQGERQESGKQVFFERLRVKLNENVFCASHKQRCSTF